MEKVDLAIVGAGAAGLMAAIFAARAARTAGGRRVVVLDGARRIGAKILIAGGGRCNVTHDVVDETAFAGSTRPAIRKVLRRFGVSETISFFRELGVELKREETGKLFPVTDRARTVLAALIEAARGAGAELRYPRRVESVTREDDAFLIEGPPSGPDAWGSLRALKAVLAAGGRSVPNTGSDGHGYAIARSLGHTITPRVLPALVPLTLPRNHFICKLSGVSSIATLELRSPTGKRLAAFTDSMLCAHFGVSGPVVLDISRYYLDAAAENPGAHIVINWLPGANAASVEEGLRKAGRAGAGSFMRGRLPERLARSICDEAGVDPSLPCHSFTREQRRRLASALTSMPLPVIGDRGFAVAEVTAGGVPLPEIHLDTMRSRVSPGLSLCGEICDVDGRIGGYNFQWAWSSGWIAGVSAWDGWESRPDRASV